MNGLTCEYEGEKYTDEMRSKGIDLAFSKGNGSGVGTEGVYYPNLIELADGWVYEMMGPDNCENQGYFYANEDDIDWED